MRSRDLRAVVVGATVIVASWLALRGLPQATAWVKERRLDTERLAQQVAHGRRVRLELDRLSDSIVRMEETADGLHDLLLIGEDPQTATFDLTRRLTMLLSEHPVFVESIRAEPDAATAGPLGRAAARATLESDLKGLLGSLEAVVKAPALGIGSLRISAINPSSPPDEQERLQAQVVVTGWFRRSDDTDSSESASP